jgi:hypothetical protein
MLYIYSKAKRRTNMNDVENKTMKNGRLIKYVDLLDEDPLRVSVFRVCRCPEDILTSRAVYVRRVRSSVGYA